MVNSSALIDCVSFVIIFQISVYLQIRWKVSRLRTKVSLPVEETKERMQKFLAANYSRTTSSPEQLLIQGYFK